MADERRGRDFIPDVVQRELLKRLDAGYRKVSERDSTLLPLPHEKAPQPTIYKHGFPSAVLSLDAAYLAGGEFTDHVRITASWVVDFLKTMLGPYKMYKMMTDQRGLVITSNSLSLAMRHVKIINPLAQILLGAGLSLEREYGDHSVYASLLAALVVRNCSELLARGYVSRADCLSAVSEALRIAGEAVDRLSRDITPSPQLEETLIRRAKSWVSPAHAEKAAKITREILGHITPSHTAAKPIRELIDFRTVKSSSISDSVLVDGVAYPKELPHPEITKTIRGARVAILLGGLVMPQKVGRSLRISHEWGEPGEMARGHVARRALLINYAREILESGANIVVVEKGVDEAVFPTFIENKAMIIRRFSPPEVRSLAEATGAKPTKAFNKISREDLGYAEVVESRKIVNKEWVFFKGCKNRHQLTVILASPDERGLMDFEEKIKSATTFIHAVRGSPRFVPGGGAAEEEISRALTEYALKLPSRVQLALIWIAGAFEELISFLAQNAGADPINTLTTIRREHERGRTTHGFNADSQEVSDTWDALIIDHSQTKKTAIENALTAAYTILRLDAGIRGRKLSEQEYYYLKRTRRAEERKKEMRRDYGLETLEI